MPRVYEFAKRSSVPITDLLETNTEKAERNGRHRLPSRGSTPATVLEVGDPAPTVSAPNQHGDSVQIDGEEPTVVYFYPKDETPGCRTEAVQFSAELETYREAGVEVYGVSIDDVESHRAFAESNDIDIDLLADPDGELADAFGVERGPQRSDTPDHVHFGRRDGPRRLDRR